MLACRACQGQLLCHDFITLVIIGTEKLIIKEVDGLNDGQKVELQCIAPCYKQVR